MGDVRLKNAYAFRKPMRVKKPGRLASRVVYLKSVVNPDAPRP